MHEVKWTENGKAESREFDDRDEAFSFQSGLAVLKADNPDRNIVLGGVWSVRRA